MEHIPFKWLIIYYYIKYKYFIRFPSRKSLSKYQMRKIKKHLRYICRKSAFYSEYKEKDLQEFPVIDKTVMMTHFDAMNTVHINKETAFEIAYAAEISRDFRKKYHNITVGLSSGTSGNRGLFIVSDSERAKWAGALFAKMLPKGIFHRYKIAFFLRADSNLYQSVNSNRISFRFFDLIETLETNITRLNDFSPDILVAPASMLKLLAESYDQLKIHPYKLISVAEVLDVIDRTFIEKVFGLECDEIYQATEGFLGYRIGKEFTINEDILYIEKEYIGEGRFIPVITDFSRKSQPVIRYRLNDIWKENKQQPGVYLSVNKIEGREDDMIILKDRSNELKYIFPDFISRIIITSSDDIQEYRVIVDGNLLAITIELKIADENNRSTIETNIKKKLNDLLDRNNIEITSIVFCSYIPHAKHEKKRRILFSSGHTSNISDNNN